MSDHVVKIACRLPLVRVTDLYVQSMSAALPYRQTTSGLLKIGKIKIQFCSRTGSLLALADRNIFSRNSYPRLKVSTKFFSIFALHMCAK